MVVKQILPGLYQIALGIVNVYLIDDDGELTVVDTGIPGNDAQILAAVGDLGHSPRDVRHILVTHCHYDHAGSLAALKHATGAPAYMHALDAALVCEGRSMRPFSPAPGFLNRILVGVFMRSGSPPIEATPIEHEVGDGEELPIAGGITAIYAPGHSAGQLTFLWQRHSGVLFAADAAAHMMGLSYSIVYEDFEEGKRSLARLTTYDFDTACFGHGNPIVGGAAARFRQHWGAIAAQS